MGLTNVPIASLIGGVSQQPASVRHPSQCEEVVNMVPSVANGLRTRQGSSFKTQIIGTQFAAPFTHKIVRDESERYFVAVENSTLRVWDKDGVERTVNFPDGTTYLVHSGDAREAFNAVSVADHTFITNKQKTVSMVAHSPTTTQATFYVVIKTGLQKVRYYINLDGTSFSYDTGGSGSYQTLDIADALADAINLDATWDCTQLDNVLVITKAAGGTFTASVTDTYGDQAMFGFFDTVNRYEDLSRKFVENVIVKIKGDADNSTAAWYAKWVRETPQSDGLWTETRAANIDYALDATTMPHELVRESDGTFTFRKVVWTDRLVGDDESNPLPSFVGSTINAVFFHRNRLGFLADENVILSQVGKYFNFFATTARSVLDSDPIDKSGAATEVAILQHVVPFDRSLFVTAGQRQFQFTGGDALTPKTAKLDTTTAFELNPRCAPVAIGSNVYFPVNAGSHSQVREYFFDANSRNNDAADITAHVPEFVPTDVYKLCADSKTNMLFALAKNNPNVWVYNNWWNGDEKVQSAWHLWAFPLGIPRGMELLGEELWFIVDRISGQYLEVVQLSEAQESLLEAYTPKLDAVQLMLAGTGTYFADQDKTLWTVGFQPRIGQTKVVLLGSDNKLGRGYDASVVSEALKQVMVDGDHSARAVYIGLAYDSYFTFSTQYPKDGKGQSIIAARTQWRDCTLNYADAYYFEARVTPRGRDEQVYRFTGKPLGLTPMILGTVVMQSGSFKFPVMAKSDEVTVSIHNDSHLPAKFLAAEWQGFVAMQAYRR